MIHLAADPDSEEQGNKQNALGREVVIDQRIVSCKITSCHGPCRASTRECACQVDQCVGPERSPKKVPRTGHHTIDATRHGMDPTTHEGTTWLLACCHIADPWSGRQPGNYPLLEMSHGYSHNSLCLCRIMPLGEPHEGREDQPNPRCFRTHPLLLNLGSLSVRRRSGIGSQLKLLGCQPKSMVKSQKGSVLGMLPEHTADEGPQLMHAGVGGCRFLDTLRKRRAIFRNALSSTMGTLHYPIPCMNECQARKEYTCPASTSCQSHGRTQYSTATRSKPDLRAGQTENS